MVVSKVSNQLQEAFGERLSEQAALAVAKELGYVTGKRGRNGGTFVTPAGLNYMFA